MGFLSAMFYAVAAVGIVSGVIIVAGMLLAILFTWADGKDKAIST